MTLSPALQRRWRAARLRAFADTGLSGMPLAVPAAALAWRVGGAAVAVVAGLALAAAALALAAWRARRLDARWLQRRVDALHPGMEDSADLLFADAAALAPLQRLQRTRLQDRLAATPDLRSPWSTRRIGIACAVAFLCTLFALLWPARDQQGAGVRSAAAGTVSTKAVPRLAVQRLHIAPPAYTGLPARDSDVLDAKAPQGSRLRWTLRFAPQPRSAALEFHDGTRVALQREGDDWIAVHALERSTLYRIAWTGAPVQPLHRLDAVPDRPPQVRVLAPERSLSMMEPGQHRWSIAFEADDDYGVAADARLHVTLARGSGEQITFDESTRTLRGRGDATRRRFDTALDLAELALAPGEDLVVQLEVRDNRAPQPQSARSPSLILRRPADPVVDTVGLEGLARKVLPAYFRSQRQIIIDAEALLAARPSLPAERFLERSDALGVDQRLLRLRYGQFLGEESEGAPRPPPTHDAEEHHDHDDHGAHDRAGRPLPIDDRGQAPPSDEHEHDDHDHGSQDGHAHDRAREPAPRHDPHHDDHDHDHGTGEPADAVFGREADILAEFGHTHDLPEAATLLDPQTREILRSALREMWQSELHLRQGEPQRALPYAHRALELIKQVQQADRIYLARVGPELPPIDEGRRLGGDRAGIARRALAPAAARQEDDVPVRVWRALASPSVADAQAPDAGSDMGSMLDALDAWLRTHGGRVEDSLAHVAAIDALRNDPDCAQCRDRLRALLWEAMLRPPAAVPRREAADAAGERYLDALRESEP